MEAMGIKIAISSYSFHRFGGGPEGKDAPTVESMIDRCAALGVSGIEILWEHLVLNGQDNVTSAHQLHQYAALRGITPVTLAASHNPVQTTAEGRAVELEKLLGTIEVAAALGTPFVRAHGGRWHTLSSFHEMWDNLGEEPPADGYTIDEGYEWAIAALTEATAYAAERGVTLGLENHWGLTGTAKGCQRIHDAIDSPWFRYILDIGNYFQHPDPYAEMEQALTDLAVIHGKFYLGGGIIVEPEIDYDRVATMLAGIGYTGFISLEFEGKAHPDQGVPDAIATVRAAFGV